MVKAVIKIEEVAAMELYEWLKREMDSANYRYTKLAMQADEEAEAAFRHKERIARMYKAYVPAYAHREVEDA